METQEATYVIRPVGEGDLPCIAADLRSADANELYATYGHSRYLDGLTRSVSLSEEALVGVDPQGNPTMLYGIAPFSRRTRLVWACGTKGAFKFPKAIVENSRTTLKRWFAERPSVEYLTNFTHADNTRHHRWLEWCGAELFPATPMGPMGEPFRPFLIRRTKPCVTPD
jgi:hypothetical protein